jgi:hypothetical protein
LLIRGVKPFHSLKYNIESHKNYRRLADYAPGHLFCFKQITPQRRKRIVKEDEEISFIVLGGAGA